MSKIKLYRAAAIGLTVSMIPMNLAGCSGNNKVEDVQIESEEKNDDWVKEREELTEKQEKEREENSIDEEEVNAFFENWGHEMDQLISEENWEKVKDKVATSFITMTDFLLFDGTITYKEGKTITKKELTDSCKEKAEYVYTTTLAKVEEKHPGFTDSFTTKYETTKNFVSEKAHNGKEYVKEKIAGFGEKIIQSSENSEILTDVQKRRLEGFVTELGPQIQSTLEEGKELFYKGKDWAKDKYQSWRDNRQTEESEEEKEEEQEQNYHR